MKLRQKTTVTDITHLKTVSYANDDLTFKKELNEKKDCIANKNDNYSRCDNSDNRSAALIFKSSDILKTM